MIQILLLLQSNIKLLSLTILTFFNNFFENYIF